jgi:hypothetical protein
MRPPAGPLPYNPPPGTPLRLPLRTGYNPLSDDDYAAAAKTLGCEALVIRALAKQEGKGHGFDSYQRPVILYEPKHFLKFAGHRRDPAYQARYRAQYPDLTQFQHLPPHLFGTDNEQWQHIQKAYLLNGSAALESVSWGYFQILGDAYHDAGAASLEMFVSAMCRSEQEQLAAFVHFIASKNLKSALATKDWRTIAAGYNGRGAKGDPSTIKKYSSKLEQAYEALHNKNGR